MFAVASHWLLNNFGLVLQLYSFMHKRTAGMALWCRKEKMGGFVMCRTCSESAGLWLLSVILLVAVWSKLVLSAHWPSLFFLFVSPSTPLHVQLQNGHLHSPSPSSVRAGGTVSTDHAGDIHITKAQEGPTPHSNNKPLLPKHTADLSAGKRKLPSPERAARQTALPQPLSGRERWREQEEEEREEPQWPAKEEDEGALESLECHKLQEKQEQRGFLREGRQTERHRSRTINGGKKKNTTVCVSIPISSS